MKITVLGCGGSLGVPMTGNIWGDCDPAQPRNRRRRPSILVETEATVVLVDTGPDLRDQLLDAGVTRLDAVLYTHAHADHVHGMDDLRPLVPRNRPLPTFLDGETLATLEHRFSYALTTVHVDRGLYRAFLDPRPVDGPFTVGDLTIVPIQQDHGFGGSLGFRFGRFAYSTDVVSLDEAAFAALEGLDTWIVDATREEPHPSHSHVERTLGWIERLAPGRAYLTHLSHAMDYDRVMRRLPPKVELAYDGLVIEI